MNSLRCGDYLSFHDYELLSISIRNNTILRDDHNQLEYKCGLQNILNDLETCKFYYSDSY